MTKTLDVTPMTEHTADPEQTPRPPRLSGRRRTPNILIKKTTLHSSRMRPLILMRFLARKRLSLIGKKKKIIYLGTKIVRIKHQSWLIKRGRGGSSSGRDPHIIPGWAPGLAGLQEGPSGLVPDIGPRVTWLDGPHVTAPPSPAGAPAAVVKGPPFLCAILTRDEFARRPQSMDPHICFV